MWLSCDSLVRSWVSLRIKAEVDDSNALWTGSCNSLTLVGLTSYHSFQGESFSISEVKEAR